MRIHLWSYNYEPEPSGIAPLSKVVAEALQARGNEVTVLAAHPHYPKPVWGTAWRPYRERRNGVRVFRFPLLIGRDTAGARIRQEISYAASVGVGAAAAGRPDVMLAVSPSFPGLAPAIAYATGYRVPWALWLQDILPDGAATTGILESGTLLDAARRFERFAYHRASRIVVISSAFARNLAHKGVPEDKMLRIFNPAAIDVPVEAPTAASLDVPRMLVMGNIGFSQGLVEFVRAARQTPMLQAGKAELRIAGHGVAFDDVAAEASIPAVKMLGLLMGQDMSDELASTTLGIVTQRGDVTEFNLPSKLMNYMAHGLPVLACVRPESEAARIVEESGAGWVVDCQQLDEVPRTLERVMQDRDELARRGRAAHAYAREHFDPRGTAAKLESVLSGLVSTAR